MEAFASLLSLCPGIRCIYTWHGDLAAPSYSGLQRRSGGIRVFDCIVFVFVIVGVSTFFDRLFFRGHWEPGREEAEQTGGMAAAVGACLFQHRRWLEDAHDGRARPLDFPQ